VGTRWRGYERSHRRCAQASEVGDSASATSFRAAAVDATCSQPGRDDYAVAARVTRAGRNGGDHPLSHLIRSWDAATHMSGFAASTGQGWWRYGWPKINRQPLDPAASAISQLTRSDGHLGGSSGEPGDAVSAIERGRWRRIPMTAMALALTFELRRLKRSQYGISSATEWYSPSTYPKIGPDDREFRWTLPRTW
jgi:hypothetical protein